MHARTKKAFTILMLLTFFAISLDSGLHKVSAVSTGGKLDLFTQKEPYSGRGQNAASDAFSPGTSVELNALLTYNGFPVSGWLVAFGVVGPPNPIENITLLYTAVTNVDGLASISFRIPLSEETTFGQWITYGNSEITTEISASDIVIFKVGWIVDIISIKTLNPNHIIWEEVTKGGPMEVEIGLRNIAMTEKNATIAITILDSLGLFVGSKELSGVIVPANGTIIYVTMTLNIPVNTTLGGATIYTNAYTAPISMGGVSYCPQRTKVFTIVEHDITILSVRTSLNTVFIGETVNIDVTVANNGRESESFTINVYCNETALGTADFKDFQSNSNITTRFNWNTNQFPEGNYSISAFASPVPGEVHLSDNLFIDGIVQVKSRSHDIAVLNVAPSASFVYKGADLEITVLVKNNGDTTESFNLTVYSDDSTIDVMLVENLNSGTQKTLVFNWNTNKVAKGNYTISARAEPVQGETHTEDNIYIDGYVTVVAPPTQYMFDQYWFNWLLLLLLLLLLALILSWLLAKRRKKKHEETFYTGWSAWYYCYDPRGRPSSANNAQKNLGKEI
jgi:hypothetical protein